MDPKENSVELDTPGRAECRFIIEIVQCDKISG